MRKYFPHPWGWASLAPLVCAVHCAATPILIVVAPALAPGERTEMWLLGATVLLASGAIAAGVRRHGRIAPALPVVAGTFAWTASLLHLFHPVPEEVTTVAATLVVAAGLTWNARVRCAAGAADEGPCPACAGETAPTPFLEPVTPARGSVATPPGVATSGAGPGPIA